MRGKPVPISSPLADPMAASRGRAEQLNRRLARTSAAIESLGKRADLLDWRDRAECRLLLQTLEQRTTEAVRRLEALAPEGSVSGRKWNQLEHSCLEIEEHLGFLAQTIRNRTHPRDRLTRLTTGAARRES